MKSPQVAAPADFKRRVFKALKCWHSRYSKEGLLDDLLIAHCGEPELTLTLRQRTNLLLEQSLDRLADHNPRDAELLKLRFCSYATMEEAQGRLNYAKSTFCSMQSGAIARLSAILYGLETTARHERAAHLSGHLEAPSIQLVGIEKQVCDLAALLEGPPEPWVVSIEGIGGIGKTALAAAVMRRLVDGTIFAEFGWVSAQEVGLDLCGDVQPRPQPVLTVDALVTALAAQFLSPGEGNHVRDGEHLLARLRLRLAQVAHLIVIDNFDTMQESHEVLSLLHSLANPTKFILTSRRRLPGEPGVHVHPVPELGAHDALCLLRCVAKEHELALPAGYADEDLLPIYAAVGGNPLALLVLGQMHTRPLGLVPADPAAARLQPPDTLLAYIFRQAWDALAPADRRVLLAVCASQVTDLDAATLSALSGLSEPATMAMLQRLVQANLVIMEGGLGTCCYRVHNLTYQFLQAAAMNWMASCATAPPAPANSDTGG
ncbi:MAG: NB-ARC domain-containing protein [Caldilineaceae bacterium]